MKGYNSIIQFVQDYKLYIAAKEDSEKISREHIEKAIQLVKCGKCVEKNKDVGCIS